MNMKVIEENKPSPERMREFQQRLYEMLKRHLQEERKQGKNFAVSSQG